MSVCAVNKIDSNITGLSYAEEVCLKVLPTLAADGRDPTWYGTEPNSYSSFGGDLKTVSRQPISASRQRRKGTITGQDASGGFQVDFTQSNMLRLLQGFFFANAHEKLQTKPLNGTQQAITSVATSDDSFNAAAGLSFNIGHLIFASGFTSNNGLFNVVTPAAAKVIVTQNLTDEPAPTATAKIQAVGFQFGSGGLSMTVTPTGVKLSIAGLAAATGTLTFTANPTAADTVTIAGRTYTFVAALTGVADQVLIAGTVAATITNFVAALNATAGAGTSYGLGTIANTRVTATGAATTIVLTAIYKGISGNNIATTEVGTNTAFGAATLTGGTGNAGWNELGLTPGETIFVGGDSLATQFPLTTSNRPGYGRVNTVTDADLTLDDTTWVAATDAGAGKTIQVFFGTYLRNEPNPANIVTRSYCIERTLGLDASGLTQAQYLEGAIANEFTLNAKSEDKITADLTFIALSDSTRTGLQGIKTGARVAAPGESAINTSLDIYRTRLAVVDPTQINQTPLLGFLTDATITIKNNASAVKALGHLGGIDVTVGNFDAGGSITALFSTVAAITAIHNNADVALNIISARANAGFVFDMPLLGLGGGELKVELNSPITIPLTGEGAQNSNGYTLSYTNFPYLPTIAMPS